MKQKVKVPRGYENFNPAGQLVHSSCKVTRWKRICQSKRSYIVSLKQGFQTQINMRAAFWQKKSSRAAKRVKSAFTSHKTTILSKIQEFLLNTWAACLWPLVFKLHTTSSVSDDSKKCSVFPFQCCQFFLTSKYFDI